MEQSKNENGIQFSQDAIVGGNLNFWEPGDKIYNMNPENTSWQMILIKNPKK